MSEECHPIPNEALGHLGDALRRVQRIRTELLTALQELLAEQLW